MNDIELTRYEALLLVALLPITLFGLLLLGLVELTAKLTGGSK